jgi:predicted ABC-type exoprotein transport system permease subunit
MRSNNFFASIFISLLVTLVVLPTKSQAYLDPGSGSYFFQILIGLILTAAVSLRMMWSRFVAFLKTLHAFLFKNDPNKP